MASVGTWSHNGDFSPECEKWCHRHRSQKCPRATQQRHVCLCFSLRCPRRRRFRGKLQFVWWRAPISPQAFLVAWGHSNDSTIRPIWFRVSSVVCAAGFSPVQVLLVTIGLFHAGLTLSIAQLGETYVHFSNSGPVGRVRTLYIWMFSDKVIIHCFDGYIAW